MAAFQVLQGGVGDQGAVVQLDHLQAVVRAGAVSQVADPVVRDQLAVGQALHPNGGGQRPLPPAGSSKTPCRGGFGTGDNLGQVL